MTHPLTITQVRTAVLEQISQGPKTASDLFDVVVQDYPRIFEAIKFHQSYLKTISYSWETRDGMDCVVYQLAQPQSSPFNFFSSA
jgi:hypothetical protein